MKLDTSRTITLNHGTAPMMRRFRFWLSDLIFAIGIRVQPPLRPEDELDIPGLTTTYGEELRKAPWGNGDFS